jgi:hypothetical protein
MRIALVSALLVVTQSNPSVGVAERLTGVWAGDGTVLNQHARVQLEWAWTLDRQFLKLMFTNDMGPDGKTRRFEGHAYYRHTGNGRYRGMWFDSSGAIRPIEAQVEADALRSRWGSADTEEGETTYRLIGNDTMEVLDRVKGNDGSWRDFGRTLLTKVRTGDVRGFCDGSPTGFGSPGVLSLGSVQYEVQTAVSAELRRERNSVGEP